MSIVSLFFNGGGNRVVFSTPGEKGSFTIPSGFTTLRVKMWGGGASSAGGYSSGTITVTGGDVVKYLVAEISPNQNNGNATAVSVTGSTTAYMIAGGGGNYSDYYGGAGGGTGAAEDAPDIPGGYSYGGKGAVESSGTGTAGLGGQYYDTGNAGTGPFVDWSFFPYVYGLCNGGAGGIQTQGGDGGGGTGGNGYYGGGGGGGGYNDPDNASSGGGGGCGLNYGFSSYSGATGNGVTGRAGNYTDLDRPGTAGDNGQGGAILLILT